MTQEQFKELLTDGALLKNSAEFWSVFWNSPRPASAPPQTPQVILNDFDLAQAPELCFFAHSGVVSTSELQALCLDFLGGEIPELLVLKSPPLDLFRMQFERIKTEIENDTIKKAVPVVFASRSQTLTPHELAHCIFNLSQKKSAGYSYGAWNIQGGILGLTPEVLFVLEGTTLKTMALAGTLVKEPGARAEDLLSDPKEVEEHEYVVADLKQRLESFGVVKTGALEIMELPTLFHLRTPIEVALSGPVSAQDVLARLHPTPALGGYPRSSALRLLKSIETQPRGLFASPVTFQSREKTLCLVGIRSLTWDQNSLYAGSGCGIVGRSDFQKEWKELQKKRQATYGNFADVLVERAAL